MSRQPSAHPDRRNRRCEGPDGTGATPPEQINPHSEPGKADSGENGTGDRPEDIQTAVPGRMFPFSQPVRTEPHRNICFELKKANKTECRLAAAYRRNSDRETTGKPQPPDHFEGSRNAPMPNWQNRRLPICERHYRKADLIGTIEMKNNRSAARRGRRNADPLEKLPVKEMPGLYGRAHKHFGTFYDFGTSTLARMVSVSARMIELLT